MLFLRRFHSPLAGDEPVDEERPDIAGDTADRPRIDDAATIRVRQRDVVVLGQEADRCRGVGIGEEAVFDVEQLASTFVAKHPESRPKAIDDLAHLGQP